MFYPFWTLMLLICVGQAWAWEDHALGTWVAFKDTPLRRIEVSVESLDDFLLKEQGLIERLLESEEKWAKQNIVQYPSLPLSIQFNLNAKEPIRLRFLKALRLNPNTLTSLYVQVSPSVKVLAELQKMEVSKITFLPDLFSSTELRFYRLDTDQFVDALNILATASAEPDYGMDIGLFEDNDTAFGKVYGFGKQPFGNPNLSFGTQAPFHMGIYHQSSLIYAAAPFLKHTYPELRVHQFKSLAKLAYQTGHLYWAYRFAGWALHYVQDLTQPYHTAILPGVSDSEMLSINILDLLGAHGPKNDRVQLVSNRHLILESFEQELLYLQIQKQNDAHWVMLALRQDQEGEPLYTDRSIREEISLRSFQKADSTDQVLLNVMPKLWVDDPTYIFGQTQKNMSVLDRFKEQDSVDPFMQMHVLLADLLRDFGSSSRSFMRAVFE